MNSAFQRLQNACNFPKKYLNFDELSIGFHPVQKFQLNTSRYGTRIEVLLQNGSIVGLPERFYNTNSSQTDIDELNNSQYIMEYIGKDKNNKNRLMLDFITIDDYQKLKQKHQQQQQQRGNKSKEDVRMEFESGAGIDTVDKK